VRILVKIGGAQLEQDAPRRNLCEAVAKAKAAGNEIIIVHGGGNQIRTVGTALGLQDSYHQGLRITDKETADCVLMVLGGIVNRTLVQNLAACGVPAVGITGADGSTFSAKPLIKSDVDLGYVGSVDKVDATLVEALIQSGHTPVIATVAPGNKRATNEPFFNINADHAAGPLCSALRCDALLFLTDVDGVLDANGRLMPLLTDTDCHNLIETGVAAGGMQPKIESAQRAAQENPHAIVKIAPGTGEDCVQVALRDGAGSRFFSSRSSSTGSGALQHG
jgi:acetylglutamate kinase